MQTLFDTIRPLNQAIYRNITGLHQPRNVFTSLTDGKPDLTALANRLADEAQAKLADDPSNDFHYRTAIAYPFSLNHWLATRYSDGSYPVWYGCLAFKTSVYETVHHMITAEQDIEGLDTVGEIVRERVVYKVHCKSVLVDISHKAKQYPMLVSDDYQLTQAVGKRLYQEGHPGLLSPSARCQGVNVNIFNQRILAQPVLFRQLTYRYQPASNTMTVENAEGKILYRPKLQKIKQSIHRPIGA